MLEIIHDIGLMKVCYGFSMLMVGYLIYYLREAVKPPHLICADGPFRMFIEQDIDLIRNKFWPAFWCFEGRAQTIFAMLLRAKLLPHMNYRRELLILKDGGEIALDWAEENCSQTSPIVIILPGLTGASRAEYIRSLIIAAKKIDIRCVIFNNRGLGGVDLKTPRLYCASNYEDLIEVIDHVKKLHPDVPLGATGISLGGLILGNYLARERMNAAKQLQAAFLISVPWNVAEAAKHFEKPYLNRMMNGYLANNLCKNIRKIMSSKHLKFENINLDTVLESRTVREFDTNFTIKHFGYKNVDDYYEDATLHKKLHLIDVPLFCLSAADDPMQPIEVIPLKEASQSKNVAILVTARGGHIGWLEGLWPNTHETYMGKLFAQYFDKVFIKFDKSLFS